MSSGNLYDTVLLPEIEDRHVNHVPASLPESATDFARLIPMNHQARVEFHQVASQAKSDSMWCTHARKFLHFDSDAVKTTFDASISSGDDDDDAVTDGAVDRPDHLIRGWYRLSLERPLLPSRFAQGWVLGACQSAKLSTGIDFLLSLDGTAQNVSTRHAHILHHQVNHCLMLKVPRKKSVVLNGVEIQGREILLSELTMGITIGNLAYTLIFEEPSQTYRRKLQEILLESSYFANESHTSLDTTPSARHVSMKGYQFQTPNAFGSYGVISGCFRISDAAKLAVKRLRRTRQTFRAISSEVEIMRKLGTHSNTCSLIDVLYSDGDANSMGSRDINDVFVILTPYAPMTVRQFIDLERDLSDRTDAFHQGCKGIAYIHSQGIIHRDIKPGNLLIAESKPLRVVVADFGHSTTLHKCRDHMKGTIPYLSPEILALKNGSNTHGYWSRSCDVFSYGLVGYQILLGISRISQRGVDITTYLTMTTMLSVSGTEIDKVLINMLSWDHKQRPSLQSILDMPIWPTFPRMDDRKRKAIDE